MASTSLASFFEDLVRCETRLYNALSDAVREQHGIVLSQFEFLRFVRDHEGTRVADIAANFAIGIGATSKGIDRHEKAGWVQRLPHPTDRRSSLLALTPTGRELVDAAELTFTSQVKILIGDDENLPAAAQFLAALRTSLERTNTGMPTG